jgi:NADPH-dependent 2,4-dienoyl-CoA reductase/sulfur reductase-like enzyme/rhodanese-related sulfurtransferase
VAAGTSAAAKARRNDDYAEITVYEKDKFISYSGCGMPYYLGGRVKQAEDLTPRDEAFFKSRHNVDVKTLHEVVKIDAAKKQLRIKNLSTGEIFFDSYDKLIIATGARAAVPPIEGAEGPNVFTLRNINDMLAIKKFMETASPKTAAIIGTGFIGLEVCENLKAAGIDVTLIEKLPQVTPGLDADMAVHVQNHLQASGIAVITGASVTGIEGQSVLLADGVRVAADMTLIATGVKPTAELARAAGVATGTAGAICVDAHMKTNLPDVYACGDCCEAFHVVTGKPVYRPLGSTANKTGRIAGDVVTGGDLSFRGILGTAIFEVFGLAVAQTGLSEREAIELGYDVAVCHNFKPSKPEYMGGKELLIKGIADKADGRLLGVQIVGLEGVDKRIDVFVTAITCKAKAEDLFHLDLAYAPPFSTTKDPVMYTGMILDNAIRRDRPLITAQQLDELVQSGGKFEIIDTRIPAQYEKEHIPAAKNIPHADIRTSLDSIDRDAVVVVHCNRGNTGNAVQNILKNRGFKEVFNISGGFEQYKRLRKR